MPGLHQVILPLRAEDLQGFDGACAGRAWDVVVLAFSAGAHFADADGGWLAEIGGAREGVNGFPGLLVGAGLGEDLVGLDADAEAIGGFWPDESAEELSVSIVDAEASLGAEVNADDSVGPDDAQAGAP